MPQKRDRALLIFTTGFVFLLLALNVHLFTSPIVEGSDYAANSLLVQKAEHFTLLTGHYSRWGFHHPGPAFLYLFAAGEFLYYHLLHIVPAPYNGQLVMMIVFNGVLLGAALGVFRRHVRLSVPLALFTITVLMVVTSATVGRFMFVGNWMPDVLLFPYLLFAVCAASVLAGQTRHLPLLALSGMLLIHAHFAQFLFVGVIGGATIAFVLARAQRQGGMPAFLAEHRRALALAAAIVLVFALPPLLEIALDRPNNLDAVLLFLRLHGSAGNNLGLAIGYLACFLLFLRAEVALPKGPTGILALGFSHSYVVVYWLVLALLFAITVTVRFRMRREQPFPPFLLYLTGVAAASTVLFIFWSTRIVGGMYTFNGYFFYALHILAWLLLLAALEPRLNRRAIRTLNVLAAASVVMLAVTERTALRSEAWGSPDILRAAAAVPRAPFGSLALVFAHDDWAWAVGVANSMKRMGKPFCVEPDWSFMFSKENTCPDMLLADHILVAAHPPPCAPPCRYVYRSKAFTLTREPVARLTLPLEIGSQDSFKVSRIGFNDGAGPFRWLQKHAAVRFWLAPDLPTASCYRLALTGFALPNQPAQVAVNGRTLGTVSKTVSDTAMFVVPRDAICPGQVNQISIDTHAAPAGHDSRQIGFAFTGLRLRAASPDESCAVDPARQPQYVSISVEWAPSCYPLEGTPPDKWRWCGPDSLVVIHNSSSRPRRLALSTTVSTGSEKPVPLTIRSPFFHETVAVSTRPLDYLRTFTVPPGDHTIVFTCTAPRIDRPDDPRNRVVRFENFQLDPR